MVLYTTYIGRLYRGEKYPYK
jgi:hypothetical protein